MKTYKFLFFSFLFICCQGAWYEKHLTGDYYMIAIDGEEDMGISKNSIGIIGSTVFAVGYNEDFIIVKQHPGSLFSPVNKAITYYYIIVLDKKKIGDSLDGRIGPLTLEQFNLKRKELNIPEDLSFTIIRKKNE